ncbi:MAG: fumarylacetoacetate hydrolase family protein [Dysgonamonadaceae bacterium]|jgi:2-keto-4-pentenoate hydratase/2-oxohepta-3-ene-1,7-dioic acid hydratase in catechol pathway|nr:fumarylacetoacetate hydrolase family protein [Dysgonamonadaceae bacterium]
MKIICVATNYAPQGIESGAFQPLEVPVIFIKPDTALLRNRHPFFLPDFSTDMRCDVEIVVRIDRLGKNISRRFAARYYNEITVGVGITACDLQNRLRERGLPWEISKSFDNSAAVGDFVPINSLDTGICGINFHLDIDGETVCGGNTGEMFFPVDEIIEYASRYVTLRTGDLIFTGTFASNRRLEIGNHLEGYIFDRKVLEFWVK